MLNNNRSTLLVAAGRDENRLMRAVISVNDTIYDNEIMADEKIVMTTIKNDDGEILRYEIEGSPIDFFQIGLRYGTDEERDRIKSLPKAIREITLM